MIAQILFALVVFAAIGIVALVLIQESKGGAGAAFGGGGGAGSQSMFGARGAANFLSRATSTLVTLFFLGSLGLAYTYTSQNRGDSSDLQEDSVLNAVKEKATGVPTIPGGSGVNVDAETGVPTIPAADVEVDGGSIDTSNLKLPESVDLNELKDGVSVKVDAVKATVTSEAANVVDSTKSVVADKVETLNSVKEEVVSKTIEVDLEVGEDGEVIEESSGVVVDGEGNVIDSVTTENQ